MSPDGMFNSIEMDLRGLTPRGYILAFVDETKLDSISVGTDLFIMIPTWTDNLTKPATALVTENLSQEIVIHVTLQILLHSKWIELPQINPLYNGKHYHYIYGLSGPPTNSNAPLAFQVSF